MTDHTPTTAGKAETLEHTPTPWRIEEDWTAEIVGADGTLIGKIVYPSNINDARFLIEAVNSHATNLTRITELEAEVKALAAKLEQSETNAALWKGNYELVQSKLDDQKAAHAKMLRDEAELLGEKGWLGRHGLRRLADRIEGGD